ncbi:hypothetical protein OJ593_10565, partial [Streptococcus anginosus]|nr:hypothetical protein [Streptococcus anginosus]
RQSAFLVPGLTITIRDERDLAGTPGEHGPHEEVFHYEGGVVDFADYLATDPALTATMHLTGSETFTENVQVLDPESGHLRAQEVERTCEVDVAL